MLPSHGFQVTLCKQMLKSSKVLFFIKRTCPTNVSFTVNNCIIKPEPFVKLLGVTIDVNLNFNLHVSKICKKASAQIKAMMTLPKAIGLLGRKKIYDAFIKSNFNFCNIVWHMCSISDAKKIEGLQVRSLRFIFSDYESDYESLLTYSNTETLYLTRCKSIIKLVYDVLNKNCPEFLNELFSYHNTDYDLRDNHKLELPSFKTMKFGRNCLRYEGARLYNEVPIYMKTITDRNSFISSIKKWTGPSCTCGNCMLCVKNIL